MKEGFDLMTELTLQAYQDENALRNIGSLTRACLKRFVSSANLLQIENKIIKEMRCKEFDGYDIGPILPLWKLFCQRYIEEVYDSNLRLTDEFSDEVINLWDAFVFHELYPRLIENDEFVRNVLRVIDMLPCESKCGSIQSIHNTLNEYPMPSLIRSEFRFIRPWWIEKDEIPWYEK